MSVEQTIQMLRRSPPKLNMVALDMWDALLDIAEAAVAVDRAAGRYAKDGVPVSPVCLALHAALARLGEEDA